MKFNVLLEDLALGELGGTSAIETGSYKISEANLPKLIQIINRSLEHFYSMFYLKENTVIIQLRNGISHYYLNSEFAESNHDSTKTKFIKDNALFPFNDDIIQIIEIADLNGNSIAINDIYAQYGVMLPQPNCVHVPRDLGISELSIVYQAAHQRIPLTEPADSVFEIAIPIPMVSAFMAYIACLWLHNVGGNSHQESNAFFAKYQTQIQMLKQQGIGVKQYTGINIKPYLRGFI